MSNHTDTDGEGFVLSPLQEHLKRFHGSQSSSGWIATANVRVEGPLALADLRAALTRLCEHNEILRTSFRSLDDGRWGQVIHTPGGGDTDFTLQELDLTERNSAEAVSALDEQLLRQTAAFDLSSRNLLRVLLIHVAEDEKLLLLAQPSMTADRVSLQNLVGELALELAGEHRVEDDERIQYADVSQFLLDALEGEDGREDRKRWSAVPLADALQATLPIENRARQALDFTEGPKSHAFVIQLPSALAAQLESVVKTAASTRAAAFLACWQELLARHAGGDLTLAARSPGRAYEGLDAACGPFARFLPLAASTDASDSFADRMHHFEEAIGNAEDIHEAFDLGALGAPRDAHFPFVFEYRPLPKPFDVGDRRFTIESCRHRSEPFHLALFVETGRSSLEGALLRFEYEPRAFSEAAVHQLSAQYLALLANAVAQARTPLVECSMDTDEQRAEVTSLLTGAPLADEAQVECVHRTIARRAGETPDAVAVRAGSSTLTYGELDERSDAIAVALQQAGVEAGAFVGLYFERSSEMIASIVGTLKAGCAYLPLPPDYPAERLESMASDAEVACLLMRAKEAADMPPFGAQVLRVDELESADAKPEDRDSLNATAYAIYTSGSTGKPKGVPISHANLAYSTRARHAYYPDEVEAYLLLSPFAFDSSVAGIFWTLTQGGTLVLPPEGFQEDIPALGKAIAKAKVTHLLGLPSLWNAVLTTADAADLRSLKTVIVAGESCTPELVANHFESLADTRLYNEYGPTEATVWCTVFEATAQNARHHVPIGEPIPGGQVFVVQESGEQAPLGIPGELWVGGPGVANGYRNRPELTAEKFVAHRFGGEGRLYRTGDRVRLLADGNLEFLGRMDQQVKIRGHRIELEEIENVLAGHADVREAVVLAVDGPSSDVSLAGFVAAQDGASVGEKALRSHLEASLPGYMVPAQLRVLDKLPHLPNGKVDRNALTTLDAPAPGAPGAADEGEFRAPETPVEKVLAFLWTDLLGVPQVSLDDDFFKLGGHSILATQLFARVIDMLGVKIPLRALFEKRTLSALTETVLDTAEDPAGVERRAEIALQVIELSDEDADQALEA